MVLNVKKSANQLRNTDVLQRKFNFPGNFSEIFFSNRKKRYYVKFLIQVNVCSNMMKASGFFLELHSCSISCFLGKISVPVSFWKVFDEAYYPGDHLLVVNTATVYSVTHPPKQCQWHKTEPQLHNFLLYRHRFEGGS